MDLALFIAPAIFAALFSYALAPLARLAAFRIGALDTPGPRKIHQTPIPRLGGLAVVGAIVIVSGAMYWLVPGGLKWTLPRHFCMGIGLGLVPIVAVSLYDDIKALRACPKFIGHVVGATIAVSFGVSLAGEVHLFGTTIAIGFLAFPLSVVWIVGVTNAFNIVDGLDGLSAGLGLISSLSLSAMFLVVGQVGMAAAVLVLAGALVGFLPYNIHPARMFLGDIGATAIGFCLAAFALRGGSTLSAGFASLLPVFVLGLPIAEALISMARRFLKRFEQENAGGLFEGDRNHLHHRLLALGIDHARAVFILYGAGLLLACGALVSMFMTTREAAVLALMLLLAGFIGVKGLGYDEFAVIRNGVVLRLYDTPVLKKSMFAIFADLLIVVVGVYSAVALKTDDWNLVTFRTTAFSMIAFLAPATVGVFSLSDLYRGSWRVAGAEDFFRAAGAVLIATLTGLAARMILTDDAFLTTLSLFSIYALVALLLVIGSRASYQILVSLRRRVGQKGTRAVIYGAGRKGATVCRELTANLASELRPVAFIDDDPAKAGKLVNGVPVVGSVRTLEAALRRFAAHAVVVSSDKIPVHLVAEAHSLCERLGIVILKMHVNLDRFPLALTLPPKDLEVVAGNAAARASSAPLWATQRALDSAAVAVQALKKRTALPPATSMWLESVPESQHSQPELLGRSCKACGSFKLHRSHLRSASERLRKKLTQKRLYRCEDCGWRGWAKVKQVAVRQGLDAPSQFAPWLDSIDASLQRSASTSSDSLIATVEALPHKRPSEIPQIRSSTVRHTRVRRK